MINSSAKHRLWLLVISLLVLIVGLLVFLLVSRPLISEPEGQALESEGIPAGAILGGGIGPEYISAVNWPGVVTTSTAEFICVETPAESSGARRVTQKTLLTQEYCITALSEGAAGSVYTDYNYTTKIGEELLSFKFTLRYPSCLNYDEPARSACQTERENFDLDVVVVEFIKNYLK